VNPSERGKNGDRNSALWGTGNRGGESRSNALWGKGGRGALLTVVASLAMILPLAASATRDLPLNLKKGTTYIAPSLLQFANTHGDKEKVDVIIQSSDGTNAAISAFRAARSAGGDNQNGDNQGNFDNNNGQDNGNGKDHSHEDQKLGLVNGASALVSVKALKWLVYSDGLIVTPDANVKVSSYSYSRQLWPYQSSNAALWRTDDNYAANMPSIAVVDSGIGSRPGFDNRVIASVNLSSLPNNSPGDGRGHGTFVAGIAADSAAGHAGAAPLANLVSVDVMDDNGMGLTSDIIASCQWILDHKVQYNIKVANFSLHSSIVAPFYYDPLDRAVEKLWFNGITVVVAAGNYGKPGAPSGVKYSPGNDPFVITVGAADLNGTITTADDTIAPWSAWGHTMDGFSKPEVAAAGRYMVGPVPAGATLAIQRPDHVVAPGYMQLSGTSFAAPVVAGTAAQLIARHPDWSPDQVKGALMVSARPMQAIVGLAGGVGEITASKAARLSNPPNPNKALDAFVAPVVGGGFVFNSASWLSVVRANASWNSASWLDASWLDASWLTASWLTASWLTASWDSASWLDASWLTASWLDASWLDASWEDAAEGDALPTGPYELDPAQAAALTGDLATSPLSLPAGVLAPPAAPPVPTPDPAPAAPAAPAPAPVAPAPDPTPPALVPLVPALPPVAPAPAL
jgi:serine protease AprX